MNKDHVKGMAKDAAGKVQEATGRATDNKSQAAKGLAKQGEGKAQKAVGDLKDAARETTRKR
jgi:uncharacterized protein YjbJ (UPF0337 family)